MSGGKEVCGRVLGVWLGSGDSGLGSVGCGSEEGRTGPTDGRLTDGPNDGRTQQQTDLTTDGPNDGRT